MLLLSWVWNVCVREKEREEQEREGERGAREGISKVFGQRSWNY